MKFFVISDPIYFEGEATLINRLFEAGLAVLHLRKPYSDKASYVKLITEIDACFHERIALHSFHELLEDFPSIKRLHYPEWRRMQILQEKGHNEFSKLKNCIQSTSIHFPADLNQLEGFDYAFYGPVFDSISKSDYKGVPEINLGISEHSGIEIIALGGISPENISQIRKMGFDGLASLGSIWNNPEQAVANFIKFAKTI